MNLRFQCEATDFMMARMSAVSNPLAMLDGEGLIRATIDMCRHVSVHPLLSVFMPSEDESYDNQVSEISLRKSCISKYVKRLNNFWDATTKYTPGDVAMLSTSDDTYSDRWEMMVFYLNECIDNLRKLQSDMENVHAFDSTSLFNLLEEHTMMEDVVHEEATAAHPVATAPHTTLYPSAKGTGDATRGTVQGQAHAKPARQRVHADPMHESLKAAAHAKQLAMAAHEAAYDAHMISLLTPPRWSPVIWSTTTSQQPMEVDDEYPASGSKVRHGSSGKVPAVALVDKAKLEDVILKRRA